MVWITIILILFVIVVFIIHQYRTSHNKIKRTLEIANKTDITKIPELADECIKIFKDKLNIALNINDISSSSKNLEQLLAFRVGSQKQIIQALNTGAKNYYPFVIYAGAFLGELIKHHSSAEWEKNEDGFLSLEVKNNETSMVVYPFDKIIKCIFEKGHSDGIRKYIMIVVGILPLAEGTK